MACDSVFGGVWGRAEADGVVGCVGAGTDRAGGVIPVNLVDRAGWGTLAAARDGWETTTTTYHYQICIYLFSLFRCRVDSLHISWRLSLY